MRRSIFVLAVLLFTTTFFLSEAQAKDKWTLIEYNYSSGPVSPEYFYKMTITINRDRSANISYSTSGRGALDVKESNFWVSRSNMNRLNSAINRSRIMSVSMDDMKSDGQPLIGGQHRSVTLTVQNTDPNLDQPPRQITTPQQVKEQYSRNLHNLFDFIESLVPTRVWNEVKSK